MFEVMLELSALRLYQSICISNENKAIKKPKIQEIFRRDWFWLGARTSSLENKKGIMDFQRPLSINH